MEIKLTQENYEKEIKENGIVIVDFFATWCGPCQMLAPILSEISNEYQIKLCKINVDEEQELAMKNSIMSIPTIYFYKDGEIKSKFIGYKTKSEIEKIIKEINQEKNIESI